MGTTEDYKLSIYQDYGQFGEKEHIHLVRNIQNGRICVKKIMDCGTEQVMEFRKNNPSEYLTKVLDYFVTNDKLIVIEEYVDGVTLEEYMMGEPITEEEAVEIGLQICSALKVLHNATPMIVYRDLKPQNVMITRDKKVKLIDFDIAREFKQGRNKDTELLGTAEYAAPEQYGYFQTDNRTDIYSFGILFNYMLTRKLPIENLAKGKYKKFISQCIEFEPEKRFQSIDEIVEILKVSREKMKYTTQKTWSIIGYRSRMWWKMLVATLGYIIFLFLLFEITKNVSPFRQWNRRFWLLGFNVLTLLVISNFRGISQKSKLLRSDYVLIRIGSCIVTWLFCIIVALCCMILCEVIVC